MKKKILKLLMVVTLIVGIYGIVKVNMTLPEVIKEQSAFAIYMSKDNSKIVIDIGDTNIIFNIQIFRDFTKGAGKIVNTIKEEVYNVLE